MTRRSRGRVKWKKKGRIRWGGGVVEWRSRVTSRKTQDAWAEMSVAKKNLKKKLRNFKGNCYEILLGRGDAKFLPHLPRPSSVQFVFLMTLLWS